MSIIELLWGKENSALLQILAILVTLEYITVKCVAIRQQKLSSAIGIRGISTKVLIFVVLAICHILDEFILSEGISVQSITTFFYCSNEIISILENCAVAGVPMPQKLKDVLANLKDSKKS